MSITWYLRYAAHYPPDEIITANNEGSPYLHRWHLIPRNRIFNIYLHRFVGPDQRVMHDHPWISLAYHLRGGFTEVYAKDGNSPKQNRRIEAEAWTYRSSKFLHYLLPDAEGAWSLFMTGPKIKPWGFLTKTGWLPWKEVIANLKPHERRDY